MSVESRTQAGAREILAPARNVDITAEQVHAFMEVGGLGKSPAVIALTFTYHLL